MTKITHLYGITVNNLARHLKTTLIVCLWAVTFTASLSSTYAFDNDRLDLTITRFLDSLSYKYKGFDIKITEVSVGERFDDNTTFTNENKKEDFITNAQLGLGVKYEGKTRTFELTGDIGYQAFAKNSNFNNITQHINLNFKNEFSKRDRINLKNVFTHIEAPSSEDEDFSLQQFGRSTGRFEFFQNKFDINYSYDIAKQISLFVKYANEINIFSGSNRSNSFLNNPGVGLSYLFSPTETIFLFSYDFTSVQFENDPDATIHTIGPGIRQYITKKLFFDGKTGVDFIDSFDDENLTKPFVQASLTYIVNERTRARLSFDKKYTTSPYFADIFNNWRTSASVTRQMLERLGCSLSIFYGEGEYVFSSFEQRLLGVNSSLNYDISRNLKGRLTYTYSQLDSNFETAEYSKNTVFLGLTAGF
ncbi:hypothetical protein KsCSTR_34360 [Candidatus Kuenenia stuttgartiensis]|uniref:Beta-barrel porin 2 n=1 Tax=Kuenenia stuttgartiensis TaxID=174633 RepID=Q1Q459_KUEST|nr:outer membrane beta-barrel protein [Candidatus Kuenenia stuttgartiensis]QII12815.1 hypothetical protein KsCSTR_34360 [Candidatus Kuenenia stuttgartiensis]CAJ74807.1 hypothetical protein kuste4044 [Candidatus Kuenenia stuttgartiensis]